MGHHSFISRFRQRLAVCVLLLLCGLPLSPSPLRAEDKPLPDLNGFLQEVKKKLMAQSGDADLLRSYTYRKRVIEETLKNDNTVKKSESKEYEVFPSTERPYSRLVRRNGVPLSPKELQKQDDEQTEKDRKQREREAKMSAGERQARAEQKRKERQEQIDEVFAAYYFTLLGRETVEGHPALVIAFTPKSNAPLKSRIGRTMLKKVAGKAWIAENEHVLVKVVLEAVDTITLGAGLLAKIDKGTLITQEWKKVNDEVWLPTRSDMRLKARLLLAKGFNEHRVEEYWDYKKFTVSTRVKF